MNALFVSVGGGRLLCRQLLHGSVCLLICLTLVSTAQAVAQYGSGIGSVHPAVAYRDQLPAWVAPIPASPQHPAGGAPTASSGPLSATLPARSAQPSPGFKYKLLDLQHKVRNVGVDYSVHVKKKITAVSGLDQSNLEIEFDPQHEKILWHSLKIHRDGQVIDVRQRATARVIDREKSLEAALLFGRKTLFVIVPEVQVGDVIEYHYVLQERNPLWQKHFFLTRYLAWEQPVERYFLRVQWPRDRLIHWSVAARYDFLQPHRRPDHWVFQYDSANPFTNSSTAQNDLAKQISRVDHAAPSAWAAEHTWAAYSAKKLYQQYFNLTSSGARQMGEEAGLNPVQLFHLMASQDAGEGSMAASAATPVAIGAQAKAKNAPPIMPMVEFSEFQNWSALAAWIQEIWAGAGGTSQEAAGVYDLWQSIAQARFQRVTADPDDRLLEVIHWVQDQVRYFGLELGVGSLKPRPPELVLQSRFGDCKDKALLLITLLKAMGIEAAPVLVHSQAAQLPYQLPTPAAFNHVIVEVPWQGSQLWIDATRSWQGGRLADLHVSEYARGLVLSGDARTTWRARPVVKQRNETHVKTRVAISESADTDSTMQVTTRFVGRAADMIRAQLQRHGQDWFARGRLARYKTYYAGVSPAAPLAVSDDRSANQLIITESYAIASVWQQPANDNAGIDQKDLTMTTESSTTSSFVTRPVKAGTETEPQTGLAVDAQNRASRFYADALYPVLKALEAQVDVGVAVVSPQRVEHELEIVLPDTGWHIPETVADFKNAHFDFNYSSDLRENSVYLAYSLKPHKPPVESFEGDLETVKRDLARVKEVLVFELTDAESAVHPRNTLAAMLLRMKAFIGRHVGEQAQWLESAIVEGPVLDMIHGLHVRLREWASVGQRLLTGSESSIAQASPFEPSAAKATTAETRAAKPSAVKISTPTSSASVANQSFAPAKTKTVSSAGQVFDAIGFVLWDYARSWRANQPAQIALLITLFFWLCVRRAQRLQALKRAGGVYRISVLLFSICSLMTFGLYPLIWLWQNFGTKRRRVRLCYWVGDALGRFPTQGLVFVIFGVLVLASASFLAKAYWPLGFVGAVFLVFCPQVRALHRAGLPMEWISGGGAERQAQAPHISDGVVVRRPLGGSAAA